MTSIDQSHLGCDNVIPLPDVATVAITGVVDLCTATILDRAITRALGHHPRRVVVDLRGVTFIGAAGISVLIKARANAHAQSCALYLRSGKPSVVRVLHQEAGGVPFVWM